LFDTGYQELKRDATGTALSKTILAVNVQFRNAQAMKVAPALTECEYSQINFHPPR